MGIVWQESSRIFLDRRVSKGGLSSKSPKGIGTISLGTSCVDEMVGRNPLVGLRFAEPATYEAGGLALR